MPDRDEGIQRLVRAVAGYVAAHGYAPSIRDLMELTGVHSSSSVAYWLDACESEGLLVRAPGRSRAIALTVAGQALAASAASEKAPGDGAAG